MPVGRWDTSRLHWREASRSAATESSGLGKKNLAVSVRGIIAHTHARGCNCSCQFWSASCRMTKPTQPAKDRDGSVLLGNICCFCEGPGPNVPPALRDYWGDGKG